MRNERNHTRWEWRTNRENRNYTGFTCHFCQANVLGLAEVSGVQNRNHCPNCLCSRHMDWQEAGDRMSACKAIMAPIGLSVKWSHNKYARVLDGEMLLVHLCIECGKLSINRIAADDRVDRLRELFRASIDWADEIPQLRASNIRLLTKEDAWLIERQLGGFYGQ
jgi:hypothetical protein